MTAVEIVGALLRDRPEVTALVPVSRIKAGLLGDNVQLPALLLRTVSLIERQELNRIGSVHVTERVSVTVRAATYADQTAIISRVRKSIAGWPGSMPDAANISVLSAGTGPDVLGPGNSFEQAQDFRISFEEPT